LSLLTGRTDFTPFTPPAPTAQPMYMPGESK
jgi:hypothetical protein